jgi:hypothetical protein
MSYRYNKYNYPNFPYPMMNLLGDLLVAQGGRVMSDDWDLYQKLQKELSNRNQKIWDFEDDGEHVMIKGMAEYLRDKYTVETLENKMNNLSIKNRRFF